MYIYEAFSRVTMLEADVRPLPRLHRWHATRRPHSAACAHGGLRLLGFRNRGTLATPEIKRNT